MGNKNSSQQPQFNALVKDFKKYKSTPQKVTIKPQNKYRQSMVNSIETSSQLSPILKKRLTQCLQDNIAKAELIQTISRISSLFKNNFTIKENNSMIKNKKIQNKHVIIKFNSAQKIKKVAKIQQVQPFHHPQHQKIKNVYYIIKAEISRQSHPIPKFTKIFTQYIVEIFLTQNFDPDESKQHIEKEVYEFLHLKKKFNHKKITQIMTEAYEELLKKLLYRWCNFLLQSCLKHYKKWIMNYTNEILPEKKYAKWMESLLMDEIFNLNNNYLYEVVHLIINNHKIKLQIPKYIDLQAITPQVFQIDQPLRIGGGYFDSIFEMSEFSQITKPSNMLIHLTNLKNCICHDVDKFHHSDSKEMLENSKVIYQINSDNILGIIAYLLYQIYLKIDEIQNQCIFLKVIFGDSIFFTQGQSSYILSTITAAIEYLSSENFEQTLREVLKSHKRNMKQTLIQQKYKTNKVINKLQVQFDYIKNEQKNSTNAEMKQSSTDCEILQPYSSNQYKLTSSKSVNT